MKNTLIYFMIAIGICFTGLAGAAASPNDALASAKASMENTVAALESELAKIRSNRARPSLLDHVTVDYYGKATPLRQIATVNATDAGTLTITPWEKNMVQPIEKAIRNSGLGLNPRSAGNIIHVSLPPLTEERRRELIKVVNEQIERARIAVRNIHRDVNGDFKDLLKAKAIPEDDEKRAQTRSRKLTDDFMVRIDKVSKKKNYEILNG